MLSNGSFKNKHWKWVHVFNAIMIIIFSFVGEVFVIHLKKSIYEN